MNGGVEHIRGRRVGQDVSDVHHCGRNPMMIGASPVRNYVAFSDFA